MRSSRVFPSLVVASALAFLCACAGTMHGVVRGEGTPVTFQYQQGLDRDFYEAVVYGEYFKGQAVHADARTGVAVADGTFVRTSSTSGNIVAVMFGNQGSTMRCHMNYADSSGFTTAGGVGMCQHSAGPVIDIMW